MTYSTSDFLIVSTGRARNIYKDLLARGYSAPTIGDSEDNIYYLTNDKYLVTFEVDVDDHRTYNTHVSYDAWEAVA